MATKKQVQTLEELHQKLFTIPDVVSAQPHDDRWLQQPSALKAVPIVVTDSTAPVSQD